MATETCGTCGGRGLITDYSKKIQTSSSYYRHGEQTCYTCNGTGRITVPDPVKRVPPKSKPKKSVPSGKSTGKEDKAQGVVGLIAFIIVAVATYQNSEENWVATIIAGLVAGYIASKLYKVIIVVGFIILLIYLFTTNS